MHYAQSLYVLRPAEVVSGDTAGTPAAESVDIDTSLVLTRKGCFEHGGSNVALYQRQRAII